MHGTFLSRRSKYADVGEGENPQLKRKIRLRDGKVRELQSMTSTYFYVDRKPISAEEFLNRLFDTIKLPELLGSEEKLRKVWANPLTRRDLMQKLEKEGCHKDDLVNLQGLISAEDSDLFDVLEYIAYAKPTVSRAARVETSKDNIYNLLNTQQREFISYVLRNYLKVGVDELAVENLSTVLTAKYGSIHAALAYANQLGDTEGERPQERGSTTYITMSPSFGFGPITLELPTEKEGS